MIFLTLVLLTSGLADGNDCDCGWRIQNRIVGGVKTTLNEYPYAAAIVYDQLPYLICGASIISEYFAITAAHCALSGYKGMKLAVGQYNLLDASDRSTIYEIEKFIPHPLYNSYDIINDISLIKTKAPIVFSILVGPVCLPLKYISQNYTGNEVRALGFGTTSYDGDISYVLEYVDLNVISNEMCEDWINMDITQQQLCTYTENKDTCQGDSGGPLVYPATRDYLVGLVSYGFGCATPYPAINTRLDSFLPWIQLETQVSFCSI